MARITTDQQVVVSVAPKTAKGKPAKIDGSVTFTSSDTGVATVTSIDALTATVVAVAEGVAQITASFDADLDEGEVRNVEMSGALEVVAAEATTAEITFGEPTDQP